MATAAWTGHTRELGITGDVEKRVLVALARRLPWAIGPDHLTAVGLLGLAGAGAAYAAAAGDVRWLHVVNLGLLLNWLGDSLDGTVARVRDRQRPRYGFYVDHVVDAFGALFLLIGLGVSGLMSPWVAAAVLVGWQLMAIQVALATHVRGVFRIAWGGVGGTELRLVLAGLNLVTLVHPRLLGVLTLDVVGVVVAVLLGIALLSSVVSTARELAEEERLPPVDGGRV